jgi:hypothetical protein
MKLLKISSIALTASIIVACGTTKKGERATVASVPTPAVTTNSILLTNPANGTHAPGNEELAAIQLQYKDVTLSQLNQGHIMYTQGACVKCHGPENIYQFGETEWKSIIDRMAYKARISDTEKDIVYKYVLAMKATQPK